MSPRALAALLGVGILALAGAAIAAVALKPSPALAPSSPFDGAVMPAGVRAPDFRLRDERRQPISLAAYRGHPVVVTFLYTRCRDSCPAEAQQIKGAFDDLGHDLPAVAISVDPASDTAASARAFLAEQGMTGRLRFALGGERQLKPLWKGYGVTPERPGRAEHMALIVLVDQHGLMRVGFPQDQTTPERLAHDLRILERS